MSDRKLTEKDLSPDQRIVYDAMLDWTRNPTTLLTCGGWAGTGKSSLLGVLAAALAKDGKQCAYIAFTGRASSVLTRKLKACGVVTDSLPYKAEDGRRRGRFASFFSSNASASFGGTLHRLIYRPLINAQDEIVGFEKRTALDRPYKFIIVDEASMVSHEMIDDLKALGVPLLCIGDHGQLPPVQSSGSVVENPDLRLEKIHRQAEGNPIIQLAHAVREGARLRTLRSRFEDCEEIVFGPQRAAEDVVGEALREAEGPLDVAIICWTNKNRIRLNGMARRGLGFKGAPRKGEALICLKNQPPIFNGMRGTLEADSSLDDRAPWKLHGCVGFPDEGLEPASLEMFVPQFNREKTFGSLEDVTALGVEARSMKEIGSLMDFGYAMTCHKCVAPETLVETPAGLLRAGDLPSEGTIATPYGRSHYENLVKNPASRMLEVTTTDGYTLRVTRDHGVDVWNPNYGYVRAEAHELRAGQFLRLRLGAECDVKQSPQMHSGRPQDVRAKMYDLPKTCSALLAEFLGIMVADGTVYKKGFRIAKRHEDVADRFDYLCRELFGAKPSRFFKLNAHHVEVSSSLLVDWLRDVGGLEPNAKRVPACVLQSSLEAQAAFLRGLFEDGTVNIRESKSQKEVIDHIEFASTEAPVRESVRTMLLRFGIISGATTSRETTVYIYGQQTRTFAEKIGFVSKFKNDRLKLPTAQGTRYVVPLLHSERRSDGKLELQRHAATGPAFKDRLKFHHSEIQSIASYVGPSVCVEVPTGHQFLQNGFCGWNSQGSQFDHVVLYADMPEQMRDADRFYYTAITRSSRKLTVLV